MYTSGLFCSGNANEQNKQEVIGSLDFLLIRLPPGKMKTYAPNPAFKADKGTKKSMAIA